MVATATISEAQWATIKPRFDYLYRVQDRSLKDVTSILRDEGFRATERMYKVQIRRWKLHKHHNDEELLQLLRKHRQLQKLGATKAFRIRKRPVTVYAARRHFERKGVVLDDDTLEQPPVSPTPSGLSVVSAEEEDLTPDSARTPSSGSSSDGICTSHHYAKTPCSTDLSCKPSPNTSVPYIFNTRSEAEDILLSIRNLCTIAAGSIQGFPNAEFPRQSLKCVHDNVQQVATALQLNETQHAMQIYSEAQKALSTMISINDPWLLPAVFHFLFDYLSRPGENPAVASFLRYMSQLASTFSPNHPLALLIDPVLKGLPCTPEVVEAFMRLSYDHLTRSNCRYHEVNFCTNRIRIFALDHFGLHAEAQRVLQQDLADIALSFGPASVHNLSRLFTLAGCLWRNADYTGAWAAVEELLRLLPRDAGIDPKCFISVTGCYSNGNNGYRRETAFQAAECLQEWLNAQGGGARRVVHARQLVGWVRVGAPAVT